MKQLLAGLEAQSRFYAAKAREVRARRIDPRLTDRPDYLSALRRDGIVFVEDFIDADTVETIVGEIRTRTDLFGARSSPNIVTRNARHLLLDPEQVVPSSRVFFDSELIRGLARAYLSKNVVPDRPAVQLKDEVGETSIVDLYHIDEWRYLISAFLLLSDVGEGEVR